MLFLYVLYRDKDLPEGAIPHLLNVDEKNRALLYTVLYKYRDVFHAILTIHVPSNQKLGDIHKIPLEKGAKPVWKSMYQHSP